MHVVPSIKGIRFPTSIQRNNEPVAQLQMADDPLTLSDETNRLALAQCITPQPCPTAIGKKPTRNKQRHVATNFRIHFPPRAGNFEVSSDRWFSAQKLSPRLERGTYFSCSAHVTRRGIRSYLGPASEICIGLGTADASRSNLLIFQQTQAR